MKTFYIFTILSLAICLNSSFTASGASVKVYYTAPANNGGSPITSYIIEKQVYGSHKWIKVMQVYGNVLNCTVDNLEETLYRFRVKAVNAFGESEPSEPSDYVDLIEKPHYAEVYLRCKDGRNRKAAYSNISLFEIPNFLELPEKPIINIPFRSEE